MSNHKLTSIVSGAVGEFYKSRLDKVKNIKLNKILGRKNPYLYLTYGINDPSKLIEKILTAIEDVSSLYNQIKSKRSEYYEYNQ